MGPKGRERPHRADSKPWGRATVRTAADAAKPCGVFAAHWPVSGDPARRDHCGGDSAYHERDHRPLQTARSLSFAQPLRTDGNPCSDRADLAWRPAGMALPADDRAPDREHPHLYPGFAATADAAG